MIAITIDPHLCPRGNLKQCYGFLFSKLYFSFEAKYSKIVFQKEKNDLNVWEVGAKTMKK